MCPYLKNNISSSYIYMSGFISERLIYVEEIDVEGR